MPENTLRQVAAGVVLSQASVVFGVAIAFGALLVASMGSDPFTKWLTMEEVTWIVASISLGTATGSLLAAHLNNTFGALKVILMSSGLNIGSWMLSGFGSHTYMLLAGRILAGLFVGLNHGGSRIYIAEVSREEWRGVLCHMPAVAISVGLVSTFSLSLVIPWRYAAMICGCLPSVIHLIGALVLPNSARWLLAHGKSEQAATRSIRFFRGKTYDVSAELKSIYASVNGSGKSRTGSIVDQLKLMLTNWDYSKPVLILMGQFVFDNFCGGVVIAQYAPVIFREAAPSLDAQMCILYLGLVQMVAQIISGFLIRRMERRTVLFLAGSAGILGCLMVASYTLAGDLVKGHIWLPLVGTLLANAAAQAGVSPISYIYLSELLPIAIRPLVGNSFVLYVSFLSITFSHVFPLTTKLLGTQGVFLCIAGFNLLQILYGRFVLPETKDISLEEVQRRHFSSKMRQKSNSDVQCQSEEKSIGTSVEDRA